MGGAEGSTNNGAPARSSAASVRALFVALVAGLAVVASPTSASAYRTAADELGVPGPVTQSGYVVQVGASPVGAPTLTAEELLSAAQAGAAAWAQPCSPFRFEVAPMSMGFASDADGITSIVVVSSGWAARGYASTQAAITEARYVRFGARWVIADADILVNADTFDWATADVSLTAVLTHELGHALGLAHPCELGGVLGEPECTPELADASIMYPLYQPRADALRPDDVAGLCALYPSDPCEGVTCASGEMCDGGSCVPALVCPSGDVCPGGVCSTGGFEPGTCTAPGTLGAPCTMGEECSSRLCLTSMRHGNYCTRTCSFDDDCGPSEACADVDGRTVCAPRQSTGCAASPGSAASPTRPGATLASALLLLFWLRRR